MIKDNALSRGGIIMADIRVHLITIFVIIANLGVLATKWSLGITVQPYLFSGVILILFGDLLMLGLQMFVDSTKYKRVDTKEG
jgi:hypothetical protein